MPKKKLTKQGTIEILNPPNFSPSGVDVTVWLYDNGDMRIARLEVLGTQVVKPDVLRVATHFKRGGFDADYYVRESDWNKFFTGTAYTTAVKPNTDTSKSTHSAVGRRHMPN
jgi:hypothetical protein